MTTQAITRRHLLGAGVAAGIGAVASKRSTVAAPAVLQGEQVTLRFMTHNTLEKPAGDILKQMIAEFEEQNPDIKIQIEEVPNADILTKLTAYAEGNDLPDVIDGQFGLASFINLDAALDITDRVDAEGLRDSFIPVALQAGIDGEGHILGLPFYTGTDALYYRLDHLGGTGRSRAGADQPPCWPLWVRYVREDAYGSLHSLHAEQRPRWRNAAIGPRQRNLDNPGQQPGLDRGHRVHGFAGARSQGRAAERGRNGLPGQRRRLLGRQHLDADHRAVGGTDLCRHQPGDRGQVWRGAPPDPHW